MDPAIQDTLMYISVPIGLIVFLSLLNVMAPQSVKDEVARRRSEETAQKIWKQIGFASSIWAKGWHCPRDGSMLYSLRGFLFCPVCDYCPGCLGPLNSSAPPNR